MSEHTFATSPGLGWLPVTAIVLFILAGILAGCGQEDGKITPVPDVLPGIEFLPTADDIIESGTETGFIDIITASTETDFPDSLTFYLEAESNYPVTSIELLYTTWQIFRPTVTVTIRPDFETDIRVQTAWTWDTRKASLPPGARIEYKWVIKNAAGDRTETEYIPMIFSDDRHDWYELKSEDIILSWYEGGLSFGEDLMAAARQALAELAQNTESKLDEPVCIYIYASTRDLLDALIYPDVWTGGMAFPNYGVIVLGVAPDEITWGRHAIKHELSHMVIYQATYSPLSNVPAWLDEGLAMYAEGNPGPNFEYRLQTAIRENTLFSIRSISGRFPADYEEAELAYAQSHSLVAFLIENYGGEKMNSLLEAFSVGTSLDKALMEVYGFDSEKLGDDWRASL